MLKIRKTRDARNNQKSADFFPRAFYLLSEAEIAQYPGQAIFVKN
jgi:hypothetical protein